MDEDDGLATPDPRPGQPADHPEDGTDYGADEHAPPPPDDAAFVALANGILRARLRITRFLPDIFGNPALDILLDLFIADIEGQQRMVKECALSARIPLSTALRWLVLMEKSDLIVRRDDPEDGRRTLVNLTAPARDAVRRYLADSSAIPLRRG